ncbi:HAD family hydrolase [Planktotalea arctica]|uniref:HAD family hydrolase n=1 Tax=Planktotalea arctica TaxID=1481893 RepID=UPI00321AD59A
MIALLFGSIGSIVETSDLQRRAFNMAFAEHGLSWSWDVLSYKALLAKAGGAARIHDYASAANETVDAKAIHETKTRLFWKLLEQTDLAPRSGVTDLVSFAKDSGIKTGFVTTTQKATTALILDKLGLPEFDVVTHRGLGLPDKPDPAIYGYALNMLSVAHNRAIAVEDNIDGAAAARGAGLTVLGYAGEFGSAALGDITHTVKDLGREGKNALQTLVRGTA